MPRQQKSTTVACPGLDQLLARLAAENREDDWTELMVQHGRFIRQICRQHLPHKGWVDDAVQETLISLRTDLPQYRRGSDVEAGAWLGLIAQHRALNLLRSETTRVMRERQQQLRSEAYDPETDLGEDQEEMLRALDKLEPEHSALIQMRFYEGLSFDEIGERLHLPAGTAQRRGHRILQKMRSELVPAGRDQLAGFLGMLALLSSPDLLKRVAAGMSAGGQAGASQGSWLTKALLWGMAAAVVTGGAWWVAAGRSAPAAAPASKASVATPPAQDPTGAGSPSEAWDLVRIFKQRHPDWRLTNYGDRLNDPKVWRTEGGEWRFRDGGTAVEVRLANPGDDIRRAKLTLLPNCAVDTAPHLLVARVQVRIVNLRTGLGLGVGWAPATSDGWDWHGYALGLDKAWIRRYPREEDAPHLTGGAKDFRIGIVMDRQGCTVMSGKCVPFAPKFAAVVQGKTANLQFELRCRRSPELQTCVLSEVQVFTAGSGP